MRAKEVLYTCIKLIYVYNSWNILKQRLGFEIKRDTDYKHSFRFSVSQLAWIKIFERM